MSRYRVAVNNKNYEVEVHSRTSSTIHFSVGANDYHVSIAPQLGDAAPAARAAAVAPAPLRAASGASDPRVISAPMPGIVLRIPAKVGQELAAGQVAVVIEAMKMENNISVAAAGRVKEILVKEGSEVDGRQALIRLEPLNG